MKLKELRRVAAEKLTGCSEHRPLYAVDLICARVLGMTKNMLITRCEEEIPSPICEGILSMVQRRWLGEPLSYILGEAEFYGRPFEVGEGVLIPRPETELLVEEMLKHVTDGAIFADWCTGSGCIGITVLLETKHTKCVGVDANPRALEWAARNVRKHGLSDRFTLMRNSEPTQTEFADSCFDCIIANPPYIPANEIEGLMRDVRDYEPRDALDGGDDGIELSAKLLSVFSRLLKPGGYVGLETAGDKQAARLLKIVPNSLCIEQKILDYSGIMRHLIWRKPDVA